MKPGPYRAAVAYDPEREEVMCRVTDAEGPVLPPLTYAEAWGMRDALTEALATWPRTPTTDKLSRQAMAARNGHDEDFD